MGSRRAIVCFGRRVRSTPGSKRGVASVTEVSQGCLSHFLREMAPPGRGCLVWTVGPVSAPARPAVTEVSHAAGAHDAVVHALHRRARVGVEHAL